MIRVGIIADHHYDTSNRFGECIRLHDWIADDMRDRGVDLVLSAGDAFERRSNATERNAFAAWLMKVADSAPVLIVGGNHDVEGDLEIFGSLKARNAITVESTACVHHYAFGHDDKSLAVAALSWPRKANILARFKEAPSPETSSAVAQDALRNVLLGMAHDMRSAAPGVPRILLAHAMVSGSITSTGQPLVGKDMELSLADLALADVDFVALGHIHRHQSWEHGGVPIVYPGSPRRTAYGELEAKGYVLVRFDTSVCGCEHGYARGACGMCNNRGSVDWDFIEAPAQRMLLLEAEYEDGAPDSMAFFVEGAPKSIKDADMRLRYKVAPDQREPAKLEAAGVRAKLLEMGAAIVKVEEVVRPKSTARTAAVAKATTTWDKLEALWKHRGTELSPARRERLKTKLSALEEAQK